LTNEASVKACRRTSTLPSHVKVHVHDDVKVSLCARRAVRGSTHPLLSGAILGAVVAALGVAFLVAMRAPFLWLLVFSYTGKMIAACVGAMSTLPRRVSASSCDA
jgi:hypothetical protein